VYVISNDSEGFAEVHKTPLTKIEADHMIVLVQIIMKIWVKIPIFPVIHGKSLSKMHKNHVLV
jgi:hypothetical protein